MNKCDRLRGEGIVWWIDDTIRTLVREDLYAYLLAARGKNLELHGQG